MGLSSKQVSGDAFDWTKNLMQAGSLELPQMALVRQQHQQQQQQQMQVVPPLKCPRCDSTNTKFCYYNNYNRSQPRHFCKSCRRHWTKGGTLRNVPVGGGRKNKRQKSSTNSTNNVNDNGIGTNVQPHQQQQQLQLQQQPVAFGEEKNLSEILYQSVLQPRADYMDNSSYLDNMGTTLSLDSLVPLPNFPPTSLSTLDNNPSSSMSSRYQLPNMFSCSGKIDVLENPNKTIATTSTTGMPMPWQIPVTSSSTDPSAYWSWEDLNTLVPNDIKVPWDDSQNKQ